MEAVKLDEKNLRQAYKNGCNTTKKILADLFPDIFIATDKALLTDFSSWPIKYMKFDGDGKITIRGDVLDALTNAGANIGTLYPYVDISILADLFTEINND